MGQVHIDAHYKLTRPFGAFFYGVTDMYSNQEDYEMRDDHIQFDFFIGVKCKTLSHKPPLFPCVSWAP